MPATSPACTGSPEPHAEQLTLHHAARLRAGQSGEGHFEQLWNQLGALRESKIARSETIESKAFHPIPPVAPDRTQNSRHCITPQAFRPGVLHGFRIRASIKLIAEYRFFSFNLSCSTAQGEVTWYSESEFFCWQPSSERSASKSEKKCRFPASMA